MRALNQRRPTLQRLLRLIRLSFLFLSNPNLFFESAQILFDPSNGLTILVCHPAQLIRLCWSCPVGLLLVNNAVLNANK